MKNGREAESGARLAEAVRIYKKIGNTEKERECREKM